VPGIFPRTFWTCPPRVQQTNRGHAAASLIHVNFLYNQKLIYKIGASKPAGPDISLASVRRRSMIVEGVGFGAATRHPDARGRQKLRRPRLD